MARPQTEINVSSGVDFEAIAVVAVAKAFPYVPQREPSDPRELLHVPDLVQEKRGIRNRVGSQPDGASERDASDRREPEAPPADAHEDAAATEPRRPKLWKNVRGSDWKL